MSVMVPSAELLASRGACALISDATRHNAPTQSGDVTVRGFLADYFATPQRWGIQQSASRVLQALNRWCFSQRRQVSDGGYLSSASIMIYAGREAHLFHVGDTRVFRLRGAEFEQLTNDHSMDIGGYRYPAKALGMSNELEFDYTCITLSQGDIFLFTTQAVEGTLMPSDYVSLIRQGASDLDGACERLAETARQRAQDRGYGGDQFCFQLVRIDELAELESEQGAAPLIDDRPMPPELNVGDVIEGLEVLEVLSRTHYSRVYRVWDTLGECELVMKAPSPERLNTSAQVESFLRQQLFIRAVRSPFVVKSVKPLSSRKHLYYLMEYIKGISLSQWREHHSGADVARCLSIGQNLGKGLQALGQRDLVHQQVCPENVIVTPDGGVVLIDFSACHPRELGRERQVSELLRQVGMHEHSAPEYALGDEVGRRSDQYSLASTLYWLLTGYLPYGQSMRELISHTDLEQLTYRSACSFNSDVPEWLDNVLQRALALGREQRYRRLSDFLDALQSGDKSRRWYGAGWLWQGVSISLLALSSAVWLVR
nr:bifunctional protein-serine/threonine kinase/phosphatase [Halomonas halocynthiae]